MKRTMSNTQTHTLPKVGDIVKGYTVAGFKTTKPKKFPGFTMPSRTYVLLGKVNDDATVVQRVAEFNEVDGQLGDFMKVECGWKKGRRFAVWNEVK